MSSPEFPYAFCTKKHTIEDCEDKECEYLEYSADFCHCWCSLMLWKLEEHYPLTEEDIKQ